MALRVGLVTDRVAQGSRVSGVVVVPAEQPLGGHPGDPQLNVAPFQYLL